MPDARCVYTRHAQDQMARRGISKEAVEHILVSYHLRRPARVLNPESPAEIYIGAFNGRDLKVYVLRESNPFVVKSAVWDGPER